MNQKRASEGNSGCTVRSGENFVPFAFEEGPLHFENFGFVVDTEDGGQRRGLCSEIRVIGLHRSADMLICRHGEQLTNVRWRTWTNANHPASL